MTARLFAFETRAWQAPALFAVALIGQACALQLIYSPPWGVYHRYLPWKEILSFPHGFFLAGLVAQTIIVAWKSRSMWPEIRRFLNAHVIQWRAWILLLFLAFASVKFTWDVSQYVFELVMTAWVSGVSLLTVILFVAAIPARGMKETFCKWRRWARSQFYCWAVAIWVFAVSAVIAWFVFEGVPHIPDSVAYLFQAKYFSEGRLYLPAPPDEPSFRVSNVVNDGVKWYGYGFPGWPAVLSFGVLAGAPWLVNPLLAGLTVLLVHALLRRLYGRPIASAAISLLAVSPWFLFMSGSFMSHPVALVWTLLGLLALEWKARQGARGWPAATWAGICVGVLFLTRPLEGVLAGAVLGLFALRRTGGQLLPMAGFATAALMVGSLAFAYNHVLTGDLMYAPHTKWTDETRYPGVDRLGFGPNIGNVGWPHLDPLPGHGPLDVIINANSNFYMISSDMFGWGFGSLFFAAVAVLWGRLRRIDWLFIGIILATVLGHSFFWFSGGPDIGARYWYQALLPLSVLSVRGGIAARRQLIRLGASGLARFRVIAFVLVASVVAFINVVPWRAVTKYYRYRGMSADIGRLAETHNFGDALVFIQQIHKEDYASAFIFNPTSLNKSGTIYVLDAGPSPRAAVLRHFSSRPVWIVGRSSSDDKRMRVLSGPIAPSPQHHDQPGILDVAATGS